MDVFYVAKFDFAVFIASVFATVLVATSLKFIGLGINFRSGVVDLHETPLVDLACITLAYVL